MSEVKEPEIVEVGQLRPMLQEFNEELGRHMNNAQRFKLGRVLTIIDASFTDPEQRKAVKDLVQNMWWASNDGPSDSPMANPHADIRGLTKALGFELYPANKSTPLPSAYDESFYETHAAERYRRVANNQ